MNIYLRVCVCVCVCVCMCVCVFNSMVNKVFEKNYVV